jgi:hypothetical protein
MQLQLQYSNAKNVEQEHLYLRERNLLHYNTKIILLSLSNIKLFRTYYEDFS